ncbi:hypothetical protein F4860DRAFT_433345 [Xylaria cubensis]|nr:hypothetical protein F4860DRAFT_433345 [Xylaria cubensis]
MGHQESPPPRQRHRVPHHRRRRHHHHHHDHNSTAQTTNGKSALTLGRLNREYHALDSQNVVESWLGQLTAPVPTSWLVSSEAQNQLIHRRKRQHSQGGHISPCGQDPRRVDPSWRPQHIPPAQDSLPPRFPLPTHRNTKTKRYRHNSADSSLISDLVPHQELRELGYVKTHSEHDESSCHKPLNDAEVDTAGASSPTSHRSIAPAFKKRRRHKTRADKYDTKKLEDCKRSKEDENRPRRSKSNRRMPIVTGKNVMKNFTSEAVLNDRITVQANLKPGLFSNKRVPKEQLVTDLSFSEMPFPMHQERDVLQQKGLTGSRLSERRRESRELEQISSFFQPARANATSHKERPKLTCRKEADSKRLYRSDNTTSGFYQDSFATLSSPTSPETHRQQSSISWEDSHLIPDFSLSNHDCRPSTSGTTTYLTWSNSQDSHQARQHMDDTRPRSLEPAGSATPESIQKALAATGVYNNTGICSCDGSNNQQDPSLATRSESSSIRNNMIHHAKPYEGKGSRMRPSCSDGTGATVTSPAHLEARWNTILPPEWRPQRFPKAEVSMTDQERMTTAPDMPKSSETPGHHRVAEQARTEPIRDLHPDQLACRHQEDYSGTSPHFAATSPTMILPEIDQIIDHTTLADQDRATISSRDAMPPPPIPPSRLDSLRSSTLKPGDDSTCSVRPGSMRLVVTHGQVPDCEHSQTTDANGQPHESSREPEKVVSTPGPISWISQAITSGISSYEREKTFSRLSMRSPIYETQSIGKDSEKALALTPLPATHMAESMADFIVRIESELEESASIEEHCQQEPIMECGQLSLEMTTRKNETQNQQLMASDGPQIDHRQLATGVTDIGPKELVETNQRFHEYEELEVPVRDHISALSTECPRDDRDEFLEMLNFWRPNRFSYF